MRFDSIAIDIYARMAVVGALLAWNILEGARFQNHYPQAFVRLYPIAAWRLTLLVATILGGLWSHSVGIMMAYAVFFYVMDMEVTLDKWV